MTARLIFDARQFEKAEQTFPIALALVECIDADLTHGIRHYRDRAGRLLTTLDQVVRAILENNLDRQAG